MTETPTTTEAPAGPPGQQAEPPLQQWAILELMGHARLAGRVSTQTLGGAQLIRVDVPEVATETEFYRDGERHSRLEVIPAHTRSLGAAAIYSINWVDQAAAVMAAHRIRHQPIQPYALRDALEQMPAEKRREVLALAHCPSVQQLTGEQGDDDGHGF